MRNEEDRQFIRDKGKGLPDSERTAFGAGKAWILGGGSVV